MVTIKDIAQRAGVSFSTVSKALLDSPLVRSKTKQHVLAIAKEMGYQPNFAARSLVSKKTGAIGVVWPSIERAALSSLITGLHEKLEQEGYTTLLSMSGVESAIETFRRFQVDAILMFGDKNRDSAQIEEVHQSQIPILIYGAAGYSSFSTIDVNRGNAIRLAVHHLAELGHKKIAYIGDPMTQDPMQTVKIEAFREETARLGLQIDNRSILSIDGLEFHDGYAAAQTILQRTSPPTAVISGGIDLTRGILRAVSERGLIVPRDLSVVSYDNLPQMENLEIPMTAVGVAMSNVTSVISKTILALIEQPKSLKTIYLEPELVVRASTLFEI